MTGILFRFVRTNKRGLRRLLVSCLSPLSIGVPAAESSPLGRPGAIASYALGADPDKRPQFEKERKLTVVGAQIQLGDVERVARRDFQWAGFSFTRLNGQTYRVWVLMNSWPRANHAPTIARYLWREPDWPDAVEYVHETTGEAALPRLSLWDYGWPRVIGGGPLAMRAGAKFPDSIEFQGYPFKRVKPDQGSHWTPPGKPTIVKLNPDLLLGFMNDYRDLEGRHRMSLGKEQYTYKETDLDDWQKDVRAGFNLHQSRFDMAHQKWLWRTGVYVNNVFWYFEDWPAQLYRSNYWGRAMYTDEPAIQHMGWANSRQELAGRLSPAESARRLEAFAVQPLRERSGNYSATVINDFVDARFGRGNLNLVERDYPAWEAVWQTAWYQLAPENGVGGMVDEDFYPNALIGSYNACFGTQIPASLENASAIHVAVMRGACRNFNKKWGTAIYAYSPAALNPPIDQTCLRHMYEAGATYFWFWNCWPGLHDAHVPYPYKRAYAAAIRQAYNEHPDRDMNALLHAAKVCIVIPYGYTFAPLPLQGIKWLHLDRRNDAGLTYRQVLANAAVEVERCIRLGIKFDIAIDEPRFKPRGYEELVYAREDGTLKIVHPGMKDEMLSQPRAPERPDLGPMPTITIQIDQQPTQSPCTVKLRGVARTGAGEVSNIVQWEILSPDNLQQVNSVWEGGETIAFEAKVGGTYKVRVAMTDCFGRPALAATTINVRDAQR